MNKIFSIKVFISIIILSSLILSTTVTYSQDTNCERDTIKVGLYNLTYSINGNKKINKSRGIFIDIVDSLFTQLNIPYKKVFCTHLNAIELLKQGKIDIVPLEKSVIQSDTSLLFSFPILKLPLVIISNRFDDVENLSNYYNKPVGSLSKLDLEQFPICTSYFKNLKTFGSVSGVFNAFRYKEIDAFIANSLVVRILLWNKNFSLLKYKINLIKNLNNEFLFAVNNNPLLISQVNEGIQNLYFNGTSNEIASKWSLDSNFIVRKFNKKITVFFVVIIFVIVLLFGTIYFILNFIKIKRLSFIAEINKIVLDNVDNPIILYDSKMKKQVFRNKVYYQYEKRYLSKNIGSDEYINEEFKKERIRKLIKKRENLTDVVRIKTKTGEPLVFLVHINIFRPVENKEFICFLFTDITEIVLARQKNEKAERLKSLFLANISNDIRNPLSSIVGFSHLLSEAKNEKEIKAYSDTIIENTNYMLSLLTNIVDLALYKVDGKKLNFIWFDLLNFVKEVSAYFNSELNKLAKLNEVKLEFCSIFESCSVFGDKSKAYKVLYNFLSNACKYTSKGYIKFGFYNEGEAIYIFVLDTGIGISEENLPKVFNKFEKIDNITNGTGLGMAIVKTILVDSLGGNVGIVSKEGKGSLFYASRTAVMKYKYKKDADFSVINRVKYMIDNQKWIDSL